MIHRRRNAGVASLNGLLYVVGGDDGSSNLHSVEFYNPASDTWTLIKTTMKLLGGFYKILSQRLDDLDDSKLIRSFLTKLIIIWF